VTVSWSVSDPETEISSSTDCNESHFTLETTGITLTCTATNKVSLSSSGSVTIKIDKTAPVLALPSNITTVATGSSGATVSYSASATDNLDPSVTPICAPASGSTFGVGTATVHCYATDEAGHTTTGSFLVTVTAAVSTATNTPTSTPTSPTATQAPTDTTGSSTSGSNSSTAIVPVTGGVIDLECDTVFSAFGVTLSFINLCDQQTTIKGVTTGNLPGPLPDGLTLVKGLNVQILSEGQVLQTLPDGSGIQLDFPTPGATDGPFAVLYWNGSAWVEVTQKTSEDNVSTLVDANTANELYRIESPDEAFYKVLTTEKTGIFILVQK
jgi:hypothetical protein